MSPTVAVVGASLAGLSAARALRDQSYDGHIVVIGDEVHAPYDRPPLSKDFLAGTASLDDIALGAPDDEDLGLEWRLRTTAVGLDHVSRSVLLDDGSEPAHPASPQPLAPRGFVVAGTGWLANWNMGASSARGSW